MSDKEKSDPRGFSDTSESSSDVEVARRDALRRLGRFAAYTAPVIIAMLTSDKAAAIIS